VRYLSLAEALAVAEAVTGIEVAVHARGSRINLLDSALHAPQASFGGHDMYPEFLDQAAVLAVRISRNHPLLDGTSALLGAASLCSAPSTGTTYMFRQRRPSGRCSQWQPATWMKQGWPNGSPFGLIEKTEDMHPRPADGGSSGRRLSI